MAACCGILDKHRVPGCHRRRAHPPFEVERSSRVDRSCRVDRRQLRNLVGVIQFQLRRLVSSVVGGLVRLLRIIERQLDREQRSVVREFDGGLGCLAPAELGSIERSIEAVQRSVFRYHRAVGPVHRSVHAQQLADRIGQQHRTRLLHRRRRYHRRCGRGDHLDAIGKAVPPRGRGGPGVPARESIPAPGGSGARSRTEHR